MSEQTVQIGDYWTMESKPNEYFKTDDTWIMKVLSIKTNGIVPVSYVNWKRKGKGISFSRNIKDFGSIQDLRKSTKDEIDYFNAKYKGE